LRCKLWSKSLYWINN